MALQPNLLLQKLPGRSFVAETELDLFPMYWGEEAGLVLLGKTSASIGLMHDGTRNKVVLRINDEFKVLHQTGSNVVRLRIEMQSAGSCCFWWEGNGRSVPARETFQVGTDTWSGAKIGLYSLKRLETGPAGYADFGYFRFSPATGAHEPVAGS